MAVEGNVGAGPVTVVSVLWGLEEVEAELLYVDGAPPHEQVHLALPADPEFPDPDGFVQLVMHASELPGRREGQSWRSASPPRGGRRSAGPPRARLQTSSL